MRIRIVCWFALCALLAVPASAGLLYTNATSTTFVNGYAIDYYWDYTATPQDEFRVSNSFVIANDGTVTGFNFGAWTDQGAVVNTIDWSIGTAVGRGDLASGAAVAVSSTWIANNGAYGFDLSTVTLGGLSLPLTAGTTYWLTIGNAVPSDYTILYDGRVYWDESDGPSAAFQNGRSSKNNDLISGRCANGSVTCTGSENFEILSTTSSSDPGRVVPEPGSLALAGLGIVALAAGLRRKLL